MVVLATSFTVLGDIVGINQRGSSAVRASWNEAERLVDSRIVPTSASATSTLLVTDVDVVIKNEGRAKYTEQGWPGWEVIVRYQDTLGAERFEYFAYSNVLSDGHWTVSAIYADEATSSPEIYEPGIFNTSEEMVITVRLLRILGTGTINQVTVSSPEGRAGSVLFDG